MALMCCWECGRQVSSSVENCIHCGARLKSEFPCWECGLTYPATVGDCPNCGAKRSRPTDLQEPESPAKPTSGPDSGIDLPEQEPTKTTRASERYPTGSRGQYHFKWTATAETVVEIADGNIIFSGGTTGSEPISSIRSVSLERASNRSGMATSSCRIRTVSGRSYKVHSRYIDGVGAYFGQETERPVEYRKFIRALHEEIAREGTPCQYRVGSSPAVFYLSMLIGLLLLGGVCCLGTTSSEALEGGGFLKILVMVLIAIPALISGLKNWPRTYDPKNPPEKLLP